jgi:hypothetical protein
LEAYQPDPTVAPCECSNKLIERCSFLGSTAQCVETWKALTVYLPNASIVQATVNGTVYLFQAVQPDIAESGTQMPLFTSGLADIVKDDHVIWQNIGQYGSAITGDDYLLNVVVRDCFFQRNQCGSPVVLLTGANSTTIYVENCYFSNNQHDGSGVALRLGAIDICRVRDCIIESSGTAIRLDNESGCIIEGCYFEDSQAAHTIDQTLVGVETPGLIQIDGCFFTKGKTQNPIINVPNARAVQVENCYFNGYSIFDRLLSCGGALDGQVRLSGNYSDDDVFTDQLGCDDDLKTGSYDLNISNLALHSAWEDANNHGKLPAVLPGDVGNVSPSYSPTGGHSGAGCQKISWSTQATPADTCYLDTALPVNGPTFANLIVKSSDGTSGINYSAVSTDPNLAANGNLISIKQQEAPPGSGATVTVTGNSIVVSFQNGATNALVVDQVNNCPAAAALVTASPSGNANDAIVAFDDLQYLSGGANGDTFIISFYAMTTTPLINSGTLHVQVQWTTGAMDQPVLFAPTTVWKKFQFRCDAASASGTHRLTFAPATNWAVPQICPTPSAPPPATTPAYILYIDDVQIERNVRRSHPYVATTSSASPPTSGWSNAT